jgi:hypothetical protein
LVATDFFTAEVWTWGGLVTYSIHLSLPEPESRAMQLGQGRGPEVCDNVQTAGDRTHTLMVANDVSNTPGDRDGRRPRALPAKAVLGRPFDAVADGGDYHGEAVKPWVAAGITHSVARPSTSANQQRGLFRKDDVIADRTTDTYQCPAGERLTVRFATGEQGRPIRSYATAAWRACPLSQQCTRNPGGRRLTR